jgi:hypothetical protein
MLGIDVLDTTYFPHITTTSAAPAMLTAIYFGDRIKELTKEMCYKTYSLREVALSKSVVKGYGSEWYNAKSLGCLVFPRNFKQGESASASYGATSGCTSLEKVSFSDTFTAINKSFFDYCYSLNEVHVPQDSKIIYAFTFNRAMGLTNISLPNGITSFWGSAFCQAGISTLKLPATLQSIGDNAFHTCACLHELDIPDAVQTIGIQCFEACAALVRLGFTKNSNLTSLS